MLSDIADPILMVWFELAAAGIRLRVLEDERLQVDAPKGAMTPVLRHAIRTLKPALIAIGRGRYRAEEFQPLLAELGLGSSVLQAIAKSEQVE